MRLISRGNEVLATRRTDASGHAQFEAGLASGEGGSAPAMLAATDAQSDYAFLSLKAPAFDLTDRGVGGRPAPNGLDAFIYAERGVYRSGETAYLTALLRDAQGAAALGVPLTLVVERPDGVEFRRAAVADQGLGGHGLALALPASAPTGTWHVRAFTDPKRPPVGATTFLVEDYIPDRIEFDLTSPSGHISQKVPAKVEVAGRFLYGAPAANLDLEGDLTVAVAKERTGFAGYQFGLADEEVEPAQQPLDDLPATDAAGKASFSVNLDKLPSSTHPLEAQIAVRMAEPGGRAVEHKVTVPVTASGNMIGVKPAVLRPFAGRRRQRHVRCRRRRARRHRGRPARPALRAFAHRHPLSVLQTRRQLELRTGQDHQARRRRNGRYDDRQSRPHCPAGDVRPLPARSLHRRCQRAGDFGRLRRRLLCRVRTPIRPTCSKSRSTRASTGRAIP